MRKILGLTVAASLAFPAVASAKDYATAGVIEVGGRVAFSNTSVSREVDAPGAEAEEETITDMELSPEVTYFLMDQLGLVGALTFATTSLSEAEVSSSTVGLQVGAQYLFPVSSLHVGPDVRLGFAQQTTEFGDAKETVSGPAISIGGVAKVPFGEGGILGVGLGLDMLMGSVTQDPDPGVDITENQTGFGLSTSFSVYW